MFYRDPELFVKQAVVDRYVDDLAYSLGVERDALNVVGFNLIPIQYQLSHLARLLLRKVWLLDL